MFFFFWRAAAHSLSASGWLLHAHTTPTRMSRAEASLPLDLGASGSLGLSDLTAFSFFSAGTAAAGAAEGAAAPPAAVGFSFLSAEVAAAGTSDGFDGTALETTATGEATSGQVGAVTLTPPGCLSSDAKAEEPLPRPAIA